MSTLPFRSKIVVFRGMDIFTAPLLFLTGTTLTFIQVSSLGENEGIVAVQWPGSGYPDSYASARPRERFARRRDRIGTGVRYK